MIRTPFLDGWTVGPKLGAFEALGGGSTPQPVTLPHDAIRDLPRSARQRSGRPHRLLPRRRLRVREDLRRAAGVAREDRHRRVRGRLSRRTACSSTATSSSTSPTATPPSRRSSTRILRYGETQPHHRGGESAQGQPMVFGRGNLPSRAPARGRSGPLRAERIARDDARHRRRARDRRRSRRPSPTTPRHTRTTRVCVVRSRALMAPRSSPVPRPSPSCPARPRPRGSRLAVPAPPLGTRTTPRSTRYGPALDDEAGAEIDADAATFGIRRLQLDPAHGFRINGEVVKLRGACVHHDNGPLGAATIAAAEDRRVRLLKAAGFNALRSAHNPMSRAMLDACDRHGVLVMDELTDIWTRSKTVVRRVGDVRRPVAERHRWHSSPRTSTTRASCSTRSATRSSSWGRRSARPGAGVSPTASGSSTTPGSSRMASTASSPTSTAWRRRWPMQEASDPNTMMAGMGEQMARMNASALVTEIDRGVGRRARCRGVQLRGLPLRARRRAVPAPRDRRLRDVPREDRRDVGARRRGCRTSSATSRGRAGTTSARRASGAWTTPTPRAMCPPAPPGRTPTCSPNAATSTSRGIAAPISYYREIVFGLRTEPYIAVHRPQHHGRPTAKTPWSWDDTVAWWSWDVPSRLPGHRRCVRGRRRGRAAARRACRSAPLPSAPRRRSVARFETEYRPGELIAVARRAGAEIGRHVASDRCRAAATRRARRGVRPSPPTVLGFVAITLEDARAWCSATRIVS